MATEYYGYVERTADSYLNWAEIGKNMSDMLLETARVREEKKAALDRAAQETFNAAADAPMGQYESANQSILELANTVSNNIAIQQREMKAGRLDPNKFLIYNQNAKDSLKLGFDAAKQFNENYAEVMKGIQDGTLSQLNVEYAAMAEKFKDWGKMGWTLSPNGTIMAAMKTKKIIDGKEVYTLDSNPKDMMSLGGLKGLFQSRVPKNKLDEQISSWADTLGEDIRTTINASGLFNQGSVVSVENIMAKKYKDPKTAAILYEFAQSERDRVKEFLGQPENMASILFDSKRFTNNNVPYTMTDNENEAKKDPSKILTVYNQSTGRFEFKISAEQQKELENFTLNKMREKYKYVEKKDVTGQLSFPPGYGRTGGGERGKEKPQPQIDQAPSILVGKTIGDVKVQDNSKAFPIINLTLGDSPSEKDINATNLIVSPGGKIYLEITKPNYIKKELDEKDGEDIKSTKPVSVLLDFGKDTREIGRFAARIGMTALQLQNYAIQLAGDEFITTPDEKRVQTTTGKSGKKIVKPK